MISFWINLVEKCTRSFPRCYVNRGIGDVGSERGQHTADMNHGVAQSYFKTSDLKQMVRSDARNVTPSSQANALWVITSKGGELGSPRRISLNKRLLSGINP
jgi:hypothetical protein